MILTIIAWLIIVMQAINLIATPLMFGKERKPYSYSSFITAIIAALLVVPMCLRVLGLI